MDTRIKEDILPNSFKWKKLVFFQNSSGFFKKSQYILPKKITLNSYKISFRNYLRHNEKVENFNNIQIDRFQQNYKYLTSNKPTVLDLFCGCGGLSLGFKNADFNVLIAIDNDFPACETYSYNFNKKSVLCLDLTELESHPNNLKEKFSVDNLNFDLIIGGPPCQGFSIVGRPKINSLIKNGVWNDHKSLEVEFPNNENPHWFYNDPRNVLYKIFLNYIAYFKPKVFLMENVPGMKSYQNGKVLEQISLDFEDIGYSVQSEVLNASNFRVPQNRKRLFFLGVRCNSKKIAKERNIFIKTSQNKQKVLFPNEKFNNLFIFPTKKSKYLKIKDYENRITVRDAIGDLNEIQDFGEEVDYISFQNSNPYRKLLRKNSITNKIHNFLPRKTTERDKKIYHFLNQGDKYKDLPDRITQFYNSKEFKNHTEDQLDQLVVKTIEECMPYGDGTSFGDKFKRLKWNEPSWTVVAHLYKDGYMYIHPEQDRTISVREAARLQSFPDNFIFKSSRTNQFKQVGNAVPPLMAEVLANHIKDYFIKI